MSEWAQLLGGAVLLYFGAEWFVGGASALALALRVPQLLVGLTVVAYGTSAPEVIVGVEAAGAGHGEVALGNVLGSNIANIGLILGISTLLRPARADRSLRQRELPVLVFSALMVPVVLLDGEVQAWEGIVLLLFALAYTAWMVVAARTASVAVERGGAAVTAAAADAAGAPTPSGPWRSLGIAAFGLLMLLFGGRIFIDGAVSVAKELGMSDRLVGLSIVAVGTSLPELVTSVIAARRGHSDIAVGNVVGSNIFNVLLCLGASALAGPVVASLTSVRVELAISIAMTALAAAFIRTERTISRAEGGVALLAYAAFCVVTFAHG